MNKYFEELKGKQFPVREVTPPERINDGYPVRVADIELWWAIEDACNNGDNEAIDIDNGIYFYCDSGFIASDPTDEEIIEYMFRSGC